MYRRIFLAGLLILTAGLLSNGDLARAEEPADSPAVAPAAPSADSPAVPPSGGLLSAENPSNPLGAATLDCGRMMLLLRIRTLEEKIERLERQLAEQPQPTEPQEAVESEEAAEQAEQVSKTDAPPRYVTRKPTSRDEGLLIIDNQTMYTRQLKINDVTYSVRPGQSHLWVPLRPVTTHLTGFEDPKSWPDDQWQWNGRNYQLTIRIL